MRRVLLLLLFLLLHNGVLAGQDVVCPDPRAKSFEKELSQVVGTAVLYPMDNSAFDGAVSCLLHMYTRTDLAIAGFKWDVTHALLRIMVADPSQFIGGLGSKDENAIRLWLKSFDHAAAWPMEYCPKPDPMGTSLKVIASLKMSQERDETLRKSIVAQLKKWPCRVSD